MRKKKPEETPQIGSQQTEGPPMRGMVKFDVAIDRWTAQALLNSKAPPQSEEFITAMKKFSVDYLTALAAKHKLSAEAIQAVSNYAEAYYKFGFIGGVQSVKFDKKTAGQLLKRQGKKDQIAGTYTKAAKAYVKAKGWEANYRTALKDGLIEQGTAFESYQKGVTRELKRNPPSEH